MTRRRLFALAGAPVAALGLGGAYAFRPRGPYYDGPPSDHFDGTRFFVPGRQAPDRSTLDLLRWRLGAAREDWPESFPGPARDVPPASVEGLRVTLVGHASFLVQAGGVNLLLDPVWSERASPFGFVGPRRVNAPGIDFDALPRIDAVLLTHNHYDHFDLATLERLHRRDRPRFVAPLGNDAILRPALPGAEVQTLDWEGAATLGSVTATLVPSLHWSARWTNDKRMALWGSYVLATPAGPVYAVGDTGFGDGSTFVAHRERHGAPRLALLPIGAYEPRWFMRDQHMNPEEAVGVFQRLGARDAIGHHWGTFQLTDEGVEQPAEALSAARSAAGIDPQVFRAFRPGEVWSA